MVTATVLYYFEVPLVAALAPDIGLPRRSQGFWSDMVDFGR